MNARTAEVYERELARAPYRLTYRTPSGDIVSGARVLTAKHLRPVLRALWSRGVRLVLITTKENSHG